MPIANTCSIGYPHDRRADSLSRKDQYIQGSGLEIMVHVFLIMIGCIGHHVTLSLSIHIIRTRDNSMKNFQLQNNGCYCSIFQGNVMKIKSGCLKVCKKKNLSCLGHDAKVILWTDLSTLN